MHIDTCYRSRCDYRWLNVSFMHAESCTCKYGIIKVHLPSSAFIKCAAAKEAHDTLFEGVDPRNIKMKEIKEYLDLIVRMYELSPEGQPFKVCMLEAKSKHKIYMSFGCR